MGKIFSLSPLKSLRHKLHLLVTFGVIAVLVIAGLTYSSLQKVSAYGDKEFVTRWTNLPAGKLTINLKGNNNGFYIDWGDGSSTVVTNKSQLSHTYEKPGTYDILFRLLNGAADCFNGWTLKDNNKAQYLTHVLHWGSGLTINNTSYMFAGATNLNYLNIAPNATQFVYDMSHMFEDATAFNQPVNFKTENVTDMSYMFAGATAFNQPVNFKTSRVTNMRSMFYHAFNFNQPVNFDTSRVTDMYSMFYNAYAFNRPVNFDTRNVTTMEGMFYQATAFNQPVNFDTGNVTNMRYMFFNTKTFNQPVNFDTGNVTTIEGMFYEAKAFNQDLSSFDFSKITDNMDNFASFSRLSFANYDKLLKRWYDQFKDKSVALSPKSTGLKYCKAVNEHDFLANTKNWSFKDAQKCPTAFTTRWTDLPAGKFKIKLHGSDNTFNIDWGDGTVETKTNVTEISHNYTSAGTREIKIYASGSGQKFNGWELTTPEQLNNHPAQHLTHVLNWGNIAFTNMSYMFCKATKLNSLPNDAPNTSQVTDMSSMFFGATAFNQPVNFDTKNVTSMRAMFTNATAFNQPVNFDTKNVTNIGDMFNSAKSFNKPINFNTKNVTIMAGMFNYATTFNQPLNFDTRNVTNMTHMFNHAKSFNHPVNFNTSKVTDVSSMFANTQAFNQNLSSLDFTATQKIENFVSHSNLSIKNYDKLLKKWHDQFKDSSKQHAPKSIGLKYCKAAAEHDFLKDVKGWTLYDTKDCSEFNLAPTDITLSNTQVDENNAPNFELADITITNDPNDIPDDTNTPSLTCGTAGPDDSSFQIAGNKLILKPSANFETKNKYNICVRATDSFGKTKDKNFTINVKDINEKPTLENQTFNIAENSANGTEVGQVVASDPDNGQSLTYSIAGGNDLGIFEITTNGKLKIKDNTHLDHEQHQSVTLKIRATDNGTPALHSDADITVNITDVNEAPSIANQTLSVAENSANGTEIGQIAATDPEHQNLDYKITDGNDLGIFEIGANGKIKVKDNTNLDHEQHPTITLRVKVADSGTPALSAEADITVNITNVNEAPTWTSTDHITINEDSTTEHVLAATDPENNTLSYSAENLPSWITLENGKLALKPTQTEVGNHEIKLKVSDGTNETKQTLKITVKNVNDAPVWTSNNTITMNEKETLVHALTATDEDGDSLTYSAANLPDWITFSDNKLTLKPKKSEIGTHTLTVNVSDGTTTVPQTITITVKNVNDAPVITSEALTTATKGKPYNYTITATDEDNDPLTYSATKKPDWLNFNPTTQTLSGTPGSSEADKDYEVTLAVSDGTATTTQTFTIHVSDKNYAPVISDQTFTIAENTANDTEIGQIVATDPDASQTLTYEIASGNNLNIFEITNDGKLKIKDNTNLDYEKHQSVTLRVKVTDNGTPALSAEADITINITDVNEKPVIKKQTFSIAENSANGTEIGQVAAADPDAGQTLTYSVMSGNDLGIFEITTDGKLKVKDNTKLDHEQHQSITIKVKVTDNGSPALHSEADITINVTDVNEAPTWTSTDQLTINEDTTTEHTLAATDPENNSLTYSAKNLPNWIKLTNNKLTLKPTQTEVGNHEIKLKVSDGTNETKQTLKIVVKNVNDAPVITSNALKSATEDQPYNYTLTATDEDGDPLTYSATKKPDWLNFDPATQTLSGTPGSSETDKDYEITLTVSDGTATTTQTFTLHVNKINHAPSIADQTFTIVENTANGTEVAQIVATDPDNNQTLNYQILSGNDLNIFEITANGKLKIKDNTNLDYEKHQSVTLRIKVTDNGSPALSAEADITINITDVDDEAPTITVNKDPITLTVGDTFTAPEATCHDNQSNCILDVENNVDTTTAGSYHITYTATDEAGNKTIVTVPVTVKAKTPPTPPTPSNPSGSNQNQNQNSNQNHTTKPSSSNNTSNNPSLSLSGALSFNPNLNRRSNYRYFNNQFANQFGQNNQTDQNHDADNISSTHGKNKGKNKTAIFSLKGKATIKLKQGQKYVEPGVECNDSSSCTVSITGKVNKDLPGTYIITYKGSANGKTKTLTRKVIVKSADQTKDSKDSNIFNWWWLLIPTTVVLYGTYRYRRHKHQKSS